MVQIRLRGSQIRKKGVRYEGFDFLLFLGTSVLLYSSTMTITTVKMMMAVTTEDDSYLIYGQGILL